jgi:hypothetical protein
MRLPDQQIITNKIKTGETMGYALDTFQEFKNQAVNTKEDVEVLEALFLGNHTYEEKATIRQVKLAKLVDMI